VEEAAGEAYSDLEVAAVERCAVGQLVPVPVVEERRVQLEEASVAGAFAFHH